MVGSGYHPPKHRPFDSAWVVGSGYHPLKHHSLSIVLGWWTVDILPLSILLLG